MGTLYRAKSDNFWAAAEVGAVAQWVHVDAGATGRITISAVKNAAGVVTKPIIFQSATVNTSGASGSFVITDSARGTIAQIKASVTEKDFHYEIPLRGDLLIDPNGSDVTIAYIRD